MSFQVTSLPASVRQLYHQAKNLPILWPGVVNEAARVGIKDENVLTNIVFFLHHPERNGRAIASSESSMVEQWKAFRTMVRGMVIGLHSPSPSPNGGSPVPTPAPSDWVLDETEAWKIQKDFGTEVAAWAGIRPDGVEAQEFSPPAWMRPFYKTIFVWKSAKPQATCAINPKQRVQVLAMLRDDYAFWYARSGTQIGAMSMQAAAEAAIRDYRDYVVNRKMCPKSAYYRLLEVNHDVTLRIFLGMFLWLDDAGPEGPVSFAARAILKLISKTKDAVSD